MSTDFFGIDEKCSISYCSLIIVIIIIISPFLFLLIYLIRRKIRSLKRKIQQRIKANTRKTTKKQLPDPKTMERFSKKPQNFPKSKLIEKDRKIMKISCPAQTLENNQEKNDPMKLDITYLENNKIETKSKNTKLGNKQNLINEKFLFNFI